MGAAIGNARIGMLGSPVQPVAPINVVGALLLLGGALLATRQG